MRVLATCLPLLAFSGGLCFAQDIDRDGLDDGTFERVPSVRAPSPEGTGAIHTINFNVLGINGLINSATWEHDPNAPAVNGARGYLWIGDTLGKVHKIDTAVPAVLMTHGVSVDVDGLGWDGRYLVVNSRAPNPAIHQLDPTTGAIVSSVASRSSSWHGVCWQPGLTPTPDQYLWATDFGTSVPPLEQLPYFTGTPVVSYPIPTFSIGALCDGKTIWTSSFNPQPVYRQWDMATGAPLKEFHPTNQNPRDGTWDGHHLWDVSNTGIAWQWDLYNELQLYPVTVTLTPMAISVSPGGDLVIGVGLKNHSPNAMTARVRVDLFDDSNHILADDRLVQKLLQPGEVCNLEWTRPVPETWSAGDSFKARATVSSRKPEDRAQAWTIITVL